VSPDLPPHLPDGALIRLFLDGQESAFRALYRRHSGRLRMVVLRLLGNRRAEADDVVQEAWLAACRGLRLFRGEAQFSTWLTTIGIRAARRRLDLSPRAFVELDDGLPAPAARGGADAIDLERALAELPDGQRSVVVLHDIEGFTHEEIGDALGFPPGTSRSLLTRGRRRLRGLLTKEVLHGT
jgi:RNA polymerase sigma-70 factor (ECF subfamily)